MRDKVDKLKFPVCIDDIGAMLRNQGVFFSYK